MQNIATEWHSCGWQKNSRTLKNKLRDFTTKDVTPFFASRNSMYRSCLLKTSSAEHATILATSSAHAKVRKGAAYRHLSDATLQYGLAPRRSAVGVPRKVASAEKKSDQLPASADLPTNTSTDSSNGLFEGDCEWPQNTTPLFRQIMFLLRDLDNMFKASYNQRYTLRIMEHEQKVYTEWMANQLPILLPYNFV